MSGEKIPLIMPPTRCRTMDKAETCMESCVVRGRLLLHSLLFLISFDEKIRHWDLKHQFMHYSKFGLNMFHALVIITVIH